MGGRKARKGFPISPRAWLVAGLFFADVFRFGNAEFPLVFPYAFAATLEVSFFFLFALVVSSFAFFVFLFACSVYKHGS